MLGTGRSRSSSGPGEGTSSSLCGGDGAAFGRVVINSSNLRFSARTRAPKFLYACLKNNNSFKRK